MPKKRRIKTKTTWSQYANIHRGNIFKFTNSKIFVLLFKLLINVFRQIVFSHHSFGVCQFLCWIIILKAGGMVHFRIMRSLWGFI